MFINAAVVITRVIADPLLRFLEAPAAAAELLVMMIFSFFLYVSYGQHQRRSIESYFCARD